MTAIVFEIPAELQGYIAAAMARFMALHPEMELEFDAGAVLVRHAGNNMEEYIRKEIYHLLYREKIYQDFLNVRMDILGRFLKSC